MGSVVADNVLLTMLDAPAALCNATGVVTEQNAAFTEWAGPAVGMRIEVHAGRGALVLPGRPARGLAMTPLHGGGWLAVAGRWEASGASAAVSQAVAHRLERIETSLESNASMGLLEHPSPSVAHYLREALAASQELGVLRQQVEALTGKPRERRAPVCLLGLLREASSVFPGKRATISGDPDGDYTVEVDRGRLFTHVVGLLDASLQRLPPERQLRIALRGGDVVRVTVSVPEPMWALDGEPVTDELRSFVAARGGRLLLDAEGNVLLELPAFARTSEIRAGTEAGTVLIVDDDESTLAMMSAVLRRAGFRVLAAENGVAASVLLRDNLPDIVAIVTDAVLPGRSGMELAEEARRYDPQVPVLLVSAHPTDLLGDTDDLSDVPLLSKPFGARTLADRVRQLVELSGGAPS